jgi:3-oxoacyl-[acyl-carrier-protein] synthase-3
MSRRLVDPLAAYLMQRLREVQQRLGEAVSDAGNSDVRFALALDSMGMVEYLSILGEDCGCAPEHIEQCANHEFGTLAELAVVMERAGLVPRRRAEPAPVPAPAGRKLPEGGWLAATAVRLPQTIQSGDFLNAAIERPHGWIERHAGIEQRAVWAEKDPLDAAAEAGRQCLERAGLQSAEVEVLLVTSEAPPVLSGLAAALHYRLRLQTTAPSLEMGGACTGFLAALWTAQGLLARHATVLIISVEAATRFLRLAPGPAGEAAALFGDAAAAAVVSRHSLCGKAVPIGAIRLATDGSMGGLLRVDWDPARGLELGMHGVELAGRAVHILADAVEGLAAIEAMPVAQLSAVVVHGGNGRLPGLLAAKLQLPPDRVWSQTRTTGNLGSASLPVAWMACEPMQGPAIWAAVGAGLTGGAAYLGRSDSAV